jgi:hypothetical protein
MRQTNHPDTLHALLYPYFSLPVKRCSIGLFPLSLGSPESVKVPSPLAGEGQDLDEGF